MPLLLPTAAELAAFALGEIADRIDAGTDRLLAATDHTEAYDAIVEPLTVEALNLSIRLRRRALALRTKTPSPLSSASSSPTPPGDATELRARREADLDGWCVWPAPSPALEHLEEALRG